MTAFIPVRKPPPGAVFLWAQMLNKAVVAA